MLGGGVMAPEAGRTDGTGQPSGEGVSVRGEGVRSD